MSLLPQSKGYKRTVIRRTSQIINELLGLEGGLSRQELAEKLDVSTSTVYKYMAVMQDEGIIERTTLYDSTTNYLHVRFRLLNARLRRMR